MGLLTLLTFVTIPTSARPGAAAPHQDPGLSEHPEKAVCRVCAARSTHGAEPEAEEVAGVSYHDGKPYYFCSEDCQSEFNESPEWWAPLELPFAIPELQVRDLGGDVVPLPVNDGELTVLDFWATWCQPCKKTMRSLQKRYETGSDGEVVPLRIVGISIDEGSGALEKVRKFTEKQGVRYPIFLDDQPAPAWTALKVYAVPTILLVDREGRVVWRFTGPEGDERLEEALEQLELSDIPR